MTTYGTYVVQYGRRISNINLRFLQERIITERSREVKMTKDNTAKNKIFSFPAEKKTVKEKQLILTKSQPPRLAIQVVEKTCLKRKNKQITFFCLKQYLKHKKKDQLLKLKKKTITNHVVLN